MIANSLIDIEAVAIFANILTINSHSRLVIIGNSVWVDVVPVHMH